MIHCNGLAAGKLQAFGHVNCPARDTSVAISSCLDLRGLSTCALLEYSHKIGVFLLRQAFEPVSFSSQLSEHLELAFLKQVFKACRTLPEQATDGDSHRVLGGTCRALGPSLPPASHMISGGLDFFLPCHRVSGFACTNKNCSARSVTIQDCGEVCSCSVMSPWGQSTDTALFLLHQLG